MGFSPFEILLRGMTKELDKAYNPGKFEDDIYSEWEKSGFFNPDKLPGKRIKSYTISLPPPNATGILHLGHALMLSYQDVLIRFHRLRGKKTLWLPGEDHAALATNAVVEKQLAKEGKNKHDLGRENYLHRVNDFVMNSRNTIRNQIKKMGSSCDWSRERYTMDDGLSFAVRTVFKKMYDDGLIYRGHRIVNWCAHCESTLSDDEVKYKDEKTKLYHIKYGPFILATVRPETKFGDTGIAVHPDDKRYQRYIGKTIEAEDVLGKITLKIVADKTVDPKFGTGAIKVTPAHDFADFEIGKRHGLAINQVIDESGRLNEKTGKYKGLTTAKAKPIVAADLKRKGLLVREEEYEHQVTVCERCGTVIEPLISLQWFVNVDKKLTLKGNKYYKNKSLKDVARMIVKSGEINIIPKRFEKIYFQWMDNLHDWCISRQIWFGHRIPVYYYEENGQIKTDVSVENPKKEKKLKNKKLEQDPDTLDTWFSSGIWTFSTLGWPEKTKDLKTFHPTDVLETGYEIIFTWVARMILMTTYALGEIPFHTVYLHGMVQDKLGRKMSKSLGNGIDPIDMINKYGADALRLAMIVGSTPGNPMRLYEEKIAGYRNFVNKLWNIARFILLTVKEPGLITKEPKARSLADKWILERLKAVTKNITDDLEQFNFSKAADDLRHFTWDDLADWYVENTKIEGKKDDILLYILRHLLILWHPFTPFVTEVIWQKLCGKKDKPLIIQEWPKVTKTTPSKSIMNDWKLLQKLIIQIRNLRSFYHLSPSTTLKLYIASSKKAGLFTKEKHIIEHLARVTLVKSQKNISPIPPLSIHFNISVGSSGLIKAYLPMSGIIDIVKERERLKRALGDLTSYQESLGGKLKNKNFLNKAPETVIEQEKRKYENTGMRIREYQEQLKHLS